MALTPCVRVVLDIERQQVINKPLYGAALLAQAVSIEFNISQQEHLDQRS